MPIPSIYVTRFFQLVTARRFAQAERVLLRLREKIPRTEWNTGYFQALKGMLLAQKSNDDQYGFLSNLNFKSHDELKEYRREFLGNARNKLHADYDRGYFAAWASYMRVLAKLQFDADKPPKSKSPKKREIKTQTKAKKKMTEEAKEETKAKTREEAEKETKAEPKRREIEETEKAEKIEPSQRTLFDYSK